MFHLDTPNFEAPAVGVATSPNITGAGRHAGGQAGGRQAGGQAGQGRAGPVGFRAWWASRPAGSLVPEAFAVFKSVVVASRPRAPRRALQLAAPLLS